MKPPESTETEILIAPQRICLYPYIYTAESELGRSFDYVREYLHEPDSCASAHSDFAQTETTISIPRISQTINTARLTAFQKLKAAAVEIETFPKVSYHSLTTGGAQVLFADDNAYIMTSEQVESLLAEEAEGKERYLLRVLRELHVRRCESSGAILLHAASISTPERNGILIVGGKGSGKSSLMVWFLKNFADLHLVSNDRTFLWNSASDEILTYFPMAALLGPGLLKAAFGSEWHLDTRLSRKQDQPLSIIMARAEHSGLSSHHSDKVLFNSTDLSRLLRRENLAWTKLRAIVFPRFEPTANTVSHKKLTKQEALERLAFQCYTPKDPTYGDGWLLKHANKTQIEEQVGAVLRAAVEKPCIEVTFGKSPLSKADLGFLG